ncbi:7-cyano-7-deazaguanine synthase [Halanaeroarchaeum sulfurireducens]|uniref:Uncharacterized protein n=1 Tax=Halanaeroarchaeum sulfurireducens TaxID=1604004 RepID=A0A0F7PDU1_9EURY|nr:7-cyano-7-deazaguanine synthase [Halanaeroarchaeum sulfurireducens]AKH97508.1 hypothetical protein HLASF_1019 [Halanaeroarchaeum sulfurireducens]ALG81904.1 hypothetical protein HLASA_1008 [Halanaeroarchaeum sulfurireducens]
MTSKFYVWRSRHSDKRLVGGLDESIVDKHDHEDLASVIDYGSESRNARAKVGVEVGLDLERLATIFPDRIPDLILDLAEIAAVTFAIDKSVNRAVDVSGNPEIDRVNTRNINIQVPVLSKKLATEEAESIVSEIVSHATRDIIDFDFIHHPPKSPTIIPPSGDQSKQAVSLLSDGIDSTAGVFYNEKRDIDSKYVTLKYTNGVVPTVNEVSNELVIDPHVFRINLNRGGEFTEFSRGFLHFTYGLIAAIASGASKVQSFENGVAARFLILQDGWMTTRTVSPFLIGHFNTFTDRVLDQQIEFTNPFEHLTKTDILNIIPESHTGIVKKTVSCPHSSNYNFADQSNCNICIPCILRTIGILNSHHDIFIDEMGVCNSFTTADFTSFEFPPNGQVHKTFGKAARKNDEANSPSAYLDGMAEIAYFSRLILTEDKATVRSEYPSMYPDEVYEQHKRFAQYFNTAMRELQDRNPTTDAITVDTTRLAPESS